MNRVFIFLQAIFWTSLVASTATGFAASNNPANPNCSANFTVGSKIAKEALGSDLNASLELEKIKFQATFKFVVNFETENSVVRSGDNIFLKMKIKSPESALDIPIEICANGKDLSANLILSKAILRKGQKDLTLKEAMPNQTLPLKIAFKIKAAGPKALKIENSQYLDKPSVMVIQ